MLWIKNVLKIAHAKAASSYNIA